MLLKCSQNVGYIGAGIGGGKKVQEVRWHHQRGCASFMFPECCAEVVSFGEDHMLPDVKTVGEGIKVDEATGKFEVQICDGAMWVGVSDKACSDGIWPP
jgi:hypothetical protein